MTYLTSVASAAADAGSTQYDSPSLTVSGTSKVMLVVVGCSDSSPADPTDVVWDPAGGAQALTKLGTSGTFGGFANSTLWSLVAPADATGVVRATWATNKGERGIVVLVETGINQTSPIGTIASATGTASTISPGAVTTSAGQRVANFAHALRTGVFTGLQFGSPTGTELQDVQTTGTAYDELGLQVQTATGASTTPTWTLGEVVDGWASWAFVLNELASPPVSQSFASISAAQNLTAFDPNFTYASNSANTFSGKTSGGGLWCSSDTGAGGYVTAYYSGATFSADQYVQYTVHNGAGGNAYIGACLRNDGTNCYAVMNGNGSDFFMFKVSNTFYNGSLAAQITAPADGTVVRFEIIGSAWRVLFDGVEVASGTDIDYTTGAPGVGGNDQSNTPGYYLTNWSAGDAGIVDHGGAAVYWIGA